MIISPALWAIWVLWELAIPTSACFKAGESLIPSPTNATTLFFWVFFTYLTLSSGVWSPRDSEIPRVFPKSSTFLLLSPEPEPDLFFFYSVY